MQNDRGISKTVSMATELSGSQIDWLIFPTLAETFDPSPAKTIVHLALKRDEYRSMEGTGTVSDQATARLISMGYARTCALLQELEAAQLTAGKKTQQYQRDVR
jgi:hypothetical protein